MDEKHKRAICLSSEAGILVVVDLVNQENTKRYENFSMKGATDMYLTSAGKID